MKALSNTSASVSILTILLTQGCVTTGGYGKFYQQESFAEYERTENVRVYRYTEKDLQNLFSDGYIAIGQANFNAPHANQNQAIAQAKKVGAEVVLLSYQHTGTRQAALPMTQYHAPQTTIVRSRSYASGSAYGSGGYAHGSTRGYGTSYITSPGYTTTQYVPITIERYDHFAVFLRRR